MKSFFLQDLTWDELKSVNGGYAPPTKEQMDALREKYGPFADMICW